MTGSPRSASSGIVLHRRAAPMGLRLRAPTGSQLQTRVASSGVSFGSTMTLPIRHGPPSTMACSISCGRRKGNSACSWA
eukprot:1063826-Lingulodinium_polyedra.AAC.1